MGDVVGVPTEYGVVKFEVRDLGGISPAGRGDGALRLVRETYEDGLNGVRHIAEETIRKLAGSPLRPDRVTLELGIKISAKAGVFVANTAGDANIKLTLEWGGGPAAGGRPAAPEEEEPEET